MIPLPVLEDIIDRSGVAPRIELLLPIGVRARQLAGPHPAAGHADRAGRPPARPPHPRPPGPDHAARGRPAAARRDRGLEARPAPAHLPADRADLRPGRGRAGQGHPRRPAVARPSPRSATTCSRHRIPEEFKDASTSLAVDWTDVETFSRPPSRGTSDCADPEASWGHRSGGGPGQDSELFFGYYASAATMMRDEHGPPVPGAGPPDDRLLLPPRPGPRPGPGADRDARRRHPARRHPGRLRLRPPRRRRLGHPAPRHRRASWSRTCTPRPRTPRHPPRRHHRQRQPLLPGHPPHPARTRPARPRRHPRTGRRPRPADRRDRPVQTRPDHQRRRRRLPPGDVPRGHGQDPLPAPPRLHDPGPRPARDPHPARAPARLLHPADHHRPARRGRQDPAETRLPLQRRTASPTPGAPAPSGPSPPPRTPPPTTSPAAGPSSWA